MTCVSTAWPSNSAGVMLRRYGIVAFGMKPRRNLSTQPSTPDLLGVRIRTRSFFTVPRSGDIGGGGRWTDRSIVDMLRWPYIIHLLCREGRKRFSLELESF